MSDATLSHVINMLDPQGPRDHLTFTEEEMGLLRGAVKFASGVDRRVLASVEKSRRRNKEAELVVCQRYVDQWRSLAKKLGMGTKF